MVTKSENVLIGFAALFVVLIHGSVAAGKVEPPIPGELWDYARAQGCVKEARERGSPKDVGPRYIYGVLFGSEFGYDKKLDNAAIVCLQRSRRELPVIGETFVDEAILLLQGVEGRFSCKNALPLLSDGTASVSIKDGVWNLKNFTKLNDSGEAVHNNKGTVTLGRSVSTPARMIIVDWYGGRQIGFVCHAGGWYASTLRID